MASSDDDMEEVVLPDSPALSYKCGAELPAKPARPPLSNTHTQTESSEHSSTPPPISVSTHTGPVLPAQQQLVEFFGALDVVCSLFRTRGVACTWDRVGPAVRATCGRELTLHSLRQICAIAPNFITIRYGVTSEEIYKIPDKPTPQPAPDGLSDGEDGGGGFFPDKDDRQDQKGLLARLKRLPQATEVLEVVMCGLGKGVRLPAQRTLLRRKETFRTRLLALVTQAKDKDSTGREGGGVAPGGDGEVRDMVGGGLDGPAEKKTKGGVREVCESNKGDMVDRQAGRREGEEEGTQARDVRRERKQRLKLKKTGVENRTEQGAATETKTISGTKGEEETGREGRGRKRKTRKEEETKEGAASGGEDGGDGDLEGDPDFRIKAHKRKRGRKTESQRASESEKLLPSKQTGAKRARKGKKAEKELNGETWPVENESSVQGVNLASKQKEKNTRSLPLPEFTINEDTGEIEILPVDMPEKTICFDGRDGDTQGDGCVQGAPKAYEGDKGLEVGAVVDFLKGLPYYKDQVRHVHHRPSRAGEYRELGNSVGWQLRAALQAQNISSLYAHQAQAIDAALSGRNVVVCTATSSGKSLVYNIPVIHSILSDTECMALYLFPTKALTQDQLRSIRDLTDQGPLMGRVSAKIYDGDTDASEREAVRAGCNIVLTNPDMLHATILAHHTHWPQLFRRLRYIVVDEAHMYKGIFGAHVAMIFRRLIRLCQLHDSWPQFITCTATIANPAEHFHQLTGISTPPVVVDQDTSPQGSRWYVLWNPTVIGHEEQKPLPAVVLPPSTQGGGTGPPTKPIPVIQVAPIKRAGDKMPLVPVRRSAHVDAALLMAEMVKRGLRTICFCKVRSVCELVLKYTHTVLREGGLVDLDEAPNPHAKGKAMKGRRQGSGEQRPDLVHYVTSYRGGYTPQDRRQIEQNLFGGKLLGVVATNALELGIDIGSLDAVIQVGFPGSMASLWQQAGRAGRSGRDAVAICIGYNSALDQHFMRHPEQLFARPLEKAVINPNNPHVTWHHLLCAAYEMPLGEDDASLFGPSYQQVIDMLCAGRRPDGSRVSGGAVLAPHEGGYHHTYLIERPWQGMSIRSVEQVNYRVVDTSMAKEMDQYGEEKAFFHLHEGAILLHRGHQYLVHKLDLNECVAYVHPTVAQYHTKCRDRSDIQIINSVKAKGQVGSALQVTYASVKVSVQIYGYFKIANKSNDILDAVDLQLPVVEFQTYAVWAEVPLEMIVALETAGYSYRGAIHAVSHGLMNLLPLYVLCDPGDIGTQHYSPYETRQRPPRILVYDQRRGGVGVSESAYDVMEKMLAETLTAIESCECSSELGCPGCVQVGQCSERNAVLDKQGAVQLLHMLLA